MIKCIIASQVSNLPFVLDESADLPVDNRNNRNAISQVDSDNQTRTVAYFNMNQAAMEKAACLSSSTTCLICSTPNSSLHFGIDSCRACASFFKRAHQSGHRPPCRRGDRGCSVQKAEGSMCRGCRYDRCIAIGMAYDGPMRSSKTACQTDDAPISALSRKEESFVDLIAREYAACIERRRVQEREIVSKHNLARIPHPAEVYLTNFEAALASFTINVTETWQFLLAVFPMMRDLSFDEQRVFFRSCMSPIATADCFCRTKRIWGGFDKYAMCSVLLCSDIEDPAMWMGAANGGPMRHALLESIDAYTQDHLALMVPSFDKADICEREMYALLALMLCESDLQGELAERFQSFFEQIRRETLEDLHRFYTEEMRLSEYSLRLGNLMTICHTFREGKELFQVWFRMQITVFDLYVTETLLKDLLL